MLVLWISINLIWLTLHQQPSLNQVYNPETKFNQNHTVEVPNILASGKNVPFTLNCNFDFSENYSQNQGQFSLSLTQGDDVIYEWTGEVGSECPSWSSELVPGNYRLHTTIDLEPQMIDGTLEYELYVFLNFSIEGYLLANALGIILFLSELPLNKNKRKVKANKNSKWKPKAWNMGDATKEVEVGLITNTEDEETIVSDDIAKQRKQYEEDIQRNTLDIIPEKVPVAQPDKLEGGDDSALKGKLNSDKRIQRVSDIYDLMEEK
tara:strand:- start:292 stop:1083 length:792 start_codon:yes stop_codon:yes gene_type:complete